MEGYMEGWRNREMEEGRDRGMEGMDRGSDGGDGSRKGWRDGVPSIEFQFIF